MLYIIHISYKFIKHFTFYIKYKYFTCNLKLIHARRKEERKVKMKEKKEIIKEPRKTNLSSRVQSQSLEV